MKIEESFDPSEWKQSDPLHRGIPAIDIFCDARSFDSHSFCGSLRDSCHYRDAYLPARFLLMVSLISFVSLSDARNLDDAAAR